MTSIFYFYTNFPTNPQPVLYKKLIPDITARDRLPINL